MKTLHVTPCYFPKVGGIHTVVRELTSQLRNEGVVADVLHISPDHKTRYEEQLDGATIYRVPLKPGRLIGFTPPLRSLLKQYDLLHVHDPQCMAITANMLVQGRGIKKVLSTHGGYLHTPQYRLMKRLHWKILLRPMLAGYDAVLASSTADYQNFKAVFPRIEMLGNGVSIEKFLAIDRESSIPMTRWFFWGRFSHNKRLDQLINTVRQSRDQGLDIKLSLAGSNFDNLLPSLQNQVKMTGLEEHIQFLGVLPEDQLRVQISRHSVFITAAEYEGFGIGIVEAMASGMAILCRDIQPLNSFVTAGSNGYFLNFDASTADSELIQKLCNSSAKERQAQSAAAKAAAISHSWDTVKYRYLAAYQKVLQTTERNASIRP